MSEPGEGECPRRCAVPLTRLLARSLACAGCVNLPACSEPPSPTRGEGIRIDAFSSFNAFRFFEFVLGLAHIIPRQRHGSLAARQLNLEDGDVLPKKRGFGH